jgi:Rieske Fe-S protein
MSEPSRRTFCVTACHAATAAAIGTVLQSCGGGGGNPTGPGGGGGGVAPQLTQINGTVTGTGVTVIVDSTSPLSPVGGAALVRSPAGDILVSKTGTETFVALTAICTHEACTITGFRSSTYVCPCHGSTYNTSGAVLTGPATRALRMFPTQFAPTTNTLTIAV